MPRRNTASAISITAAMVLVASVALAGSPLGEWSTDCSGAFRLAAMPSAWTFHPAQGPVTITTQVAIDYQLLDKNAWLVIGDPVDGGFLDLIGYRRMLLEAQVRPKGRQQMVITLPGVYTIDNGKAPVVFTWDGRDQAGRLVEPGDYELEVRGRFVPVETTLSPDDNLTYRDLDSLAGVAEACTRVLSIKVSATPMPEQVGRTASCDPPPREFWMTVDATNATTLRATLHPLIDDHTLYPYSSTSTDTWDILNDADENPSDPTRVLAIYHNDAYLDDCTSGCPWNREHTWAKSFGFSEEEGNGRIPYTDCHHLRATDPSYNSSRGNLPHNDCPQPCTESSTVANNGFGGGASDVNYRKGSNTFCGSTPNAGDVWEPWPHRKGDVARTILYMDIRYEGDSGSLGPEQDLIATNDLASMRVETTACGDGYQDPAYHGVLSALLAWNETDPPDADERRRNDQVWCYQANRNPFVDHPEWASCLHTGVCTTGPTFMGIDSATDLAPCVVTGVLISWTTPQHWNDGCVAGCSIRGYRVFRDGNELTTGGCASSSLGEGATSCVDDTASQLTVYSYSVEAVNNNSDGYDGGATVDASDSLDDTTPPLLTNGPTAVPSPDSFTAMWQTDEPSYSVVRWRTTPTGPYEDNSSDATMVTSHSLAATGLTGQTTYYYQVCSADICDNGPVCSGVFEVTTGGACLPGSDTGVFVNELHYDNNGPDSNEGVEIAGPSGTELTGWSIELYDGNGGGLSALASPNPAPLSGFIDDEGSGYGALWFAIDDLENSMEGFALIDDGGSVVQFLCYEGSFTATAGTANGMTCTDIGVSEGAATSATMSLQLTGGTFYVYEDFTWGGPFENSRGALNTASGQVMECTEEAPFFTDGFEFGNTTGWSSAVP